MVSCGILLYYKRDEKYFFLLGHPGGPFLKGDNGTWTMPKGKRDKGEELFDCALREFKEETGLALPTEKQDDFLYLGRIKQRKNKSLHCWALECELDLVSAKSMIVKLKKKNGKIISFPELDKIGYIEDQYAKTYINSKQCHFLDKILGNK